MQNLLLLLKEISFNLYWSWNRDAIEIFNEINPDFWNWTGHNPVKFMNEINQSYLLDSINKKNLGGKILTVYNDFTNYLNRKKYFEEKYYKTDKPQIAYFSAEYGLTDCLKIYSGGLGVLSGDHMKSSSDLGLPLIGIGLAYHYGFFVQMINSKGWQTENYEINEFQNLPLYLLRDDNFNPVRLEINFPNSVVFVQVWVLHIGNIKLYLLDTTLPENTVEDRRITDILYGGNTEKRISQEIILGIGGIRLIEELGLDIKAFHLNEGHSAFLCFERIKNYMKKHSVTYEEAKAACYNSNIFTTHTPVPAGIDIFTYDLFVKYFRKYAEEEIGVSADHLFLEGDLTRDQADNDKFNMAYLAINNSNWIYDENIWSRIDEIANEDIWAMRIFNKHNLINFCRESIKEKWVSEGADKMKLAGAEGILNPDALTIGFARRFATYKRGNLIFRDLERLKKILKNDSMPVQFIFSGKAHPKDEGGKTLIAEIISYSQDEDLKNKIIFLDNYDINVARFMVEGCDLWLNNPRRPLEASGTSGMKVIANGGLNFSILDGWWDEGYTTELGWIESVMDENIPLDQRDSMEAASLYDTLESQIIPMFFLRDSKGMPVQWINKIKSSIKNLTPFFNTGRMVKEYCDRFYMKVK